ncbi:HNH endonuclease [Peribacillus frigoritolerans]|uniref:HNH endonuclease n=1 Tax=Peribacillus frigoritolerans TaxID=450367 RepID=UPI0023DB3FF8|nr:HNH endonuclease signature motif containing protein [Peribacillus frigoritolerans]MDF1996404.1 HNH endonuclease signature motif containing protein [Peribacillus frigoritolerans]
MKNLKEKSEVRYALWQAYKKRCAICGNSIGYTQLQIDHIIAESLEKIPNKLYEVLKKYELPKDFKINSLYNLRPACGYCNREKSYYEGPEEITAKLLRKAKNKISDVNREIKKYLEESNYALKIEAMRTAVESGELKLEEYVDLVNKFVADYGDEYVEIENSFTNFRSIKYFSVKVDGYLPRLNEPKGSCIFTFNSFYIRGMNISLSHKEILKTLFKGTKTPIDFLMRPYVIDKLNEDNFIIQLGCCRFNLSKDETIHLCKIVDKFINEYILAIDKIEKRLSCQEFIPLSNDLTKYKLIKIDQKLWELMLRFAGEHDNYLGEGKWNIFDSSGRNMIKVYNNEPTDQYNPGFHCFIHSLVEPNDRETTSELWLVWWDVEGNQKYGIRDYWTVDQTYKWLTSEFIPAVLYKYSVIPLKNKPIFKKGYSFEAYKKNIKINDLYYRESNRYLDTKKITKFTDLLELVSSLQLYYSVTRETYLEKKAVESIYDGLIYILNISPDTDYQYICSKLNIKQTSNINDLITQVIEKKTNEKGGKIFGGILDMLFRAVFAATEHLKTILNYDEIILIAKYLEPIINDYNLNKLVEVYSNNK